MGHVVQMSAEDHKVLIASMFALCPWMRIIFLAHENLMKMTRWNIKYIITKKSIEWRGS